MVAFTAFVASVLVLAPASSSGQVSPPRASDVAVAPQLPLSVELSASKVLWVFGQPCRSLSLVAAGDSLTLCGRAVCLLRTVEHDPRPDKELDRVWGSVPLVQEAVGRGASLSVAVEYYMRLQFGLERAARRAYEQARRASTSPADADAIAESALRESDTHHLIDWGRPSGVREGWLRLWFDGLRGDVVVNLWPPEQTYTGPSKSESATAWRPTFIATIYESLVADSEPCWVILHDDLAEIYRDGALIDAVAQQVRSATETGALTDYPLPECVLRQIVDRDGRRHACQGEAPPN
jgi:hypothetical protein